MLRQPEIRNDLIQLCVAVLPENSSEYLMNLSRCPQKDHCRAHRLGRQLLLNPRVTQVRAQIRRLIGVGKSTIKKTVGKGFSSIKLGNDCAAFKKAYANLTMIESSEYLPSYDRTPGTNNLWLSTQRYITLPPSFGRVTTMQKFCFFSAQTKDSSRRHAVSILVLMYLYGSKFRH